MSSSTQAGAADTRVRSVTVTDDELSVELMDGRTITAPLAWYPRLANGTPAQRQNWEIAGGGQGLHWPELDEDVSTEGLLRGLPAPRGSENWESPGVRPNAKLEADLSRPQTGSLEAFFGCLPDNGVRLSIDDINRVIEEGWSRQ